MVKVMGVTKAGYEIAAVECGQALLMTEWLAQCRSDAKQGRCWLAKADLESAGCTLSDLTANLHSKPVDYLVRLYSHYLEKQFQHVVTLLPHLEFDCARSVTAMIGNAWRTILKLQRSPEMLFKPDGAVTGSDHFNAKVRFLLGLKDELPFAVAADHGAHH
jgi:phytoene/squalene synthetase